MQLTGHWGKRLENISGGGTEEPRHEPEGEKSWLGQDLWEEVQSEQKGKVTKRVWSPYTRVFSTSEAKSLVIETGGSQTVGGSRSAQKITLMSGENKGIADTVSETKSSLYNLISHKAKCDGVRASSQSQKDSHSMKGWWDLRWVRHRLTGVRLHPHLSRIYRINISWCWKAVKGAGSDWIKGRRSPQQSETRMSWGAFTGSRSNPPQLNAHTVLGTFQGAVCIAFRSTGMIPQALSWLRCYFFQVHSFLWTFIVCPPKNPFVLPLLASMVTQQ